MERLCVHPADVSRITGISLRAAQKLIKNLKFILHKEKHQYITPQELAGYLGIDVADIELK